MQQELPHLPQSEINKKISESWRLLSVAERSYYLEKAKLEKEGLDPVSKAFFFSQLISSLAQWWRLGRPTPLFFCFLGKTWSYFSFLSLLLSVLIGWCPALSCPLWWQQYTELTFSELSAVSLRFLFWVLAYLGVPLSLSVVNLIFL